MGFLKVIQVTAPINEYLTNELINDKLEEVQVKEHKVKDIKFIPDKEAYILYYE